MIKHDTISVPGEMLPSADRGKHERVFNGARFAFAKDTNALREYVLMLLYLL